MDQIETVDVPDEIFEVSSTSSEEIEEIQEEINDKLIRKFQTNHAKYKYLLNFKRWPIFEFLELEFILQIRMAMIFYDQAILIVTRDEMVYGFGNNINNCLGIGHINALQPEKVQVLCGKNIKKFVRKDGNGPQMFALTEEGEVYSWGDAVKPGLGHAFNFNDERVWCGVTIPTQISLLSRKCITDIKCSDNHTLALTNDGEVYFWGLTNINLNENIRLYYSFQDTPKQVDFNGKKIVQIACGSFFSMALSDENKVYSWGKNISGDVLGTNITLHQPNHELNPHQIELSEEKAIKLVCCGNTYTLALTIEGEIYGWGNNDYIQSGLDKRNSNFKYPTLLDMPERVLDIAIAQDSKSNIILGKSGCIYIWGMKLYFGQMCSRPTITSFLNMSEALMFINMPLTVFADDDFKYMDEEIDILKCWETLFDNPSSSDLIIQVKGQPIHVHKAILKRRSSYFRTIFQDDSVKNQIKRKKEEKQDVMEHFEYSYIVYKAFLKYLYTDIVDLSMEELLELLDLTIAYCENKLEKYCILEIKRKTTVPNVAFIYSTTIKYNKKDLLEFCCNFALKHEADVIWTESFDQLDKEIRDDFLIKIDTLKYNKSIF